MATPQEKKKAAKPASAHTVFYSYCPLGHLCMKGNAHLGRSDTEAQARQRLRNHLESSYYHQGKLSPEEIEQFVKDAEVPESYYDENGDAVEEDDDNQSRRSRGSAKSRASASTARPPPSRSTARLRSRSRHGRPRPRPRTPSIEPPRSKPSSVVVAPPIMPKAAALLQQMTRAADAIKAAANMARNAAEVFDREYFEVQKACNMLQEGIDSNLVNTRR